MGMTPKDSSSNFSKRDMSPLQQRVEAVLQSQHFELFFLSMAVLSALMFGWQTDYMAKNDMEDSPISFHFVDIAFLLFFALELGLRMFVHRMGLFRIWGWGWHLLDTVLVVTQVLEELLLIIQVQQGDTSQAADNLLRAARMLRAIRIIRVLHVMRFVEELRLLASCLLHSSRAFCGSLVLLCLLVYMCSMVVTQASLFYRLDYTADSEGRMLLKKWFGRVPTSVLSLFGGLTGGVDWLDLADPLIAHISPMFGIFFVVYTAFALLAVMNVVTAIFVQSAIERASQVKSVQRVAQARRLFRFLDTDGSGVITYNELDSALHMPEVVEFFRSIDIDVSEAKCLFEMLDGKGTGQIHFTDFLTGCLRLQGPAKAIDLVVVMRELKAFMQEHTRDDD